jgi:retron-type reverse transcriptase
MILNALYEPDFDKINSNDGFRPNVGIHEAINTISVHAKAMTYAIEADITGAFDNVDHDRLIDILRKKIADEKFLKLIYWSLKCGISYAGAFQESKLGTTQGSPLSPILYNIYFHEFDKYIKEEFSKEMEEINLQEKLA